MADIAATQCLARERLGSDNTSVAEIAVIVDETVVACLFHDPGLINRWTLERLADLWRIGAPLDVFLRSDLPRLDRRQYKLLIELDQEPAGGVEYWRQKAREAGVHLYTEAGDQVLAEKEWLVLHAASDGVRRIVLPHPCRVVEALTGLETLAGGTELTAELRQGQTTVWRLVRSPA